MKEINWYALDTPKHCEICGNLGRHTTVFGEVLCDRCAIIVNRSKYIVSAEEFFKKTLWGYIIRHERKHTQMAGGD